MKKVRRSLSELRKPEGPFTKQSNSFSTRLRTHDGGTFAHLAGSGRPRIDPTRHKHRRSGRIERCNSLRLASGHTGNCDIRLGHPVCWTRHYSEELIS